MVRRLKFAIVESWPCCEHCRRQTTSKDLIGDSILTLLPMPASDLELEVGARLSVVVDDLRTNDWSADSEANLSMKNIWLEDSVMRPILFVRMTTVVLALDWRTVFNRRKHE
jgi:hypothetical protein